MNAARIEVGRGVAELVEPNPEDSLAGDRHAAPSRGEMRAGMRRDCEARFAAARQGGGAGKSGMQQQPGSAARPSRQNEAAGGGEPVMLAAPEFGQHREGSGPERFLERPKGLVGAMGPHHDHAVRVEAMGLQSRPVGIAALAGGAIVDDPDQHAAPRETARRHG